MVQLNLFYGFKTKCMSNTRVYIVLHGILLLLLTSSFEQGVTVISFLHLSNRNNHGTLTTLESTPIDANILDYIEHFGCSQRKLPAEGTSLHWPPTDGSSPHSPTNLPTEGGSLHLPPISKTNDSTSVSRMNKRYEKINTPRR